MIGVVGVAISMLLAVKPWIRREPLRLDDDGADRHVRKGSTRRARVVTELEKLPLIHRAQIAQVVSQAISGRLALLDVATTVEESGGVWIVSTSDTTPEGHERLVRLLTDLGPVTVHGVVDPDPKRWPRGIMVHGPRVLRVAGEVVHVDEGVVVRPEHLRDIRRVTDDHGQPSIVLSFTPGVSLSRTDLERYALGRLAILAGDTLLAAPRFVWTANEDLMLCGLDPDTTLLALAALDYDLRYPRHLQVRVSPIE